MANLRTNIKSNRITVLMYQLCVIANCVFGREESLFIVSKLTTLLFMGWMFLRILQQGKVKYNHILLLPVFFTLYCGATFLWSPVPDAVLGQMVTQVQLLLLLLVTFWAVSDGVTVMDYLKAMYISGFGLAIFLVIREGGLQVYINAMLDGQRIGGVLSNTYGMVFSNAALVAAYYIIMEGRKKHIFSFALFVFFAFSGASRKAMVMVVIGVVAIAVMHYGWRRLYRTLLLTAAIVLLLYWVMQLPVFWRIRDRIADMLAGEADGSSYERQRMVSFGWEKFKARPLFGYGVGSFSKMHISGVYSHHNYIELMVSGGVIGLCLYYAMLLLPSAALVFSRKKGEKLDNLHLMLLTSVVLELACGFAMVQVYVKNAWLLMGLLMAEAVRATHSKPELPNRVQEIENESAQ